MFGSDQIWEIITSLIFLEKRLIRAYNSAYTMTAFEWNWVKARLNEDRHGISFADTFGVFEDPNALTIDQDVGGEKRFVTIGIDGFGRLLVVVYTWRGENIRVISARKATRSEVRQYENKL